MHQYAIAVDRNGKFSLLCKGDLEASYLTLVVNMSLEDVLREAAYRADDTIVIPLVTNEE